MGEAYFYHLTRRPLELTLSDLAAKSLERGWRVAVRGVEPARMDWLDQALWTVSEEGFLPHGLAGAPHAADQPVLLTTAREAVNAASVLMSMDGAAVEAEDVTAMQRVCVLFDGHNEDAVARARVQWKTLTGAGCKAQYWSEESGRWEKKAEA